MGLRRIFRDARARARERQAPPPLDGRLLITGTGRAGTTLLVRIMINLGLDTGFQKDDVLNVEGNAGRAGLEHEITEAGASGLPDIVKAPWATDILHDALGNGWLKLWHVVIPVRDLTAAADSRRAAQSRAEASGIPSDEAPGGLWKTTDPTMQEQALAIQFYKAVEALVAYDVPFTMISFPRFVHDQDYFVELIGPLLARAFGVKEADLRRAHSEECRPDFITAGRS